MATTTLNISLPEALKLAGLRRDIAIGIDQLDGGQVLDGERIFAEQLDEGLRR